MTGLSLIKPVGFSSKHSPNGEKLLVNVHSVDENDLLMKSSVIGSDRKATSVTLFSCAKKK